MKTFFEDNYINKAFLSTVKREVEREQLNKTIDEINYLNELQEHLLERYDVSSVKNSNFSLIKKFNNARR